jgi:hypothetical protein
MKRKPRPPVVTTLPASFAEVEAAEITAVVEHWYSLIVVALGSDSGHVAVQNDLYRQLTAGDAAALDVAYIVAMADGGHPPADHALRAYIYAHIDADRFAGLPLQVRAYTQRALTRPPLAVGYPSNCPQVVNDFTRDIAIVVLIDQIVLRWPAVPKLYSSNRHRSAASHVALIFTRHGMKLANNRCAVSTTGGRRSPGGSPNSCLPTCLSETSRKAGRHKRRCD